MKVYIEEARMCTQYMRVRLSARTKRANNRKRAHAKHLIICWDIYVYFPLKSSQNCVHCNTYVKY